MVLYVASNKDNWYFKFDIIKLYKNKNIVIANRFINVKLVSTLTVSYHVLIYF
ncbi:hypothetical protein NLO413_1035 [Candidatus Neoehrlichia lotoris str. RAC413]|uniref:Uncharacterized protein n=1 Tax=Candidatus Neoehrlichia procyonis str. RAC413 TaxID=1359163 RepID=A0A0F3NNL1_9RICK|nr:hypothetical protein NLO413_1035 [Candidatus Neoehrlichia lotoris str. RAC413]